MDRHRNARMHMQYKVDPEEALALPSFAQLYALTGLVGLLVALDMSLWAVGLEAWRTPWGVSLSLAAALIGGGRIIYGALVALLDGDAGADLALAIAMIASIVLGEYWVAAEVVLIAMIGESLEAFTFGRTHREVGRLLELRPRTVRLRRHGQEVEVPADQVQPGDLLIVRPGERIAVDGLVAAGRSAVDQSTLTGESLPVDKGPNDRVFAGTLNQMGALEIEAEQVGAHTVLGQVIEMVAEARSRKARVERVADRMARLFLPMVLLAAAVTFVATNLRPLSSLTFGGGAFSWNWMPTLAVLVVTCPCALILATPAATMAALAWTARRGVLLKGGYALERLASVRRLAFDKTGTLTTGELKLGEIVSLEGSADDAVTNDLLAMAAAAEQPSEHLIARAVVRAAAERQLSLPAIDDFLALPGSGVSARLRDQAESALLIGNARLFAERGIAITADAQLAIDRLERAGETALLVARDGRLRGLIGVRDTVRSEAAGVLQQLRADGIEQFALLTGDRRPAAERVAHDLRISEVHADLRPDEKAHWLAGWRSQLHASDPSALVGMIGDGVNDAPSLASADVGIALGSVGCDLAAEAGDVVILGAPLASLPGLLRLARQTVRVIYQNIVIFAFFVNVLGIVLTAWVMPGWSAAWSRRAPVAAALFHQAGSVLVLLNSMRLLWFERWQTSWLGRTEDALAEQWQGVATQLNRIAEVGRRLWQRRRRLALVGAVAAIIAYVATGIVVVAPDEVVAVRRCGQLLDLLPPGLHVCLPWPWDTFSRQRAHRVATVEIGMRTGALRSAAIDTASMTAGAASSAIEWNSPHRDEQAESLAGEATVLTGDHSLVEIGATVQYRIDDLPQWLFGVRDPEAALRTLAESALREVIAAKPVVVAANHKDQQSEILTDGRASIEQAIAERLQALADHAGLGIEILAGGVCLQDVHPPLDVVPAFRDVSSAFKEKGRMLNEADADYRQKVILAAGRDVWQRLKDANTEVTESLWTEMHDDLAGEASAELHAAEAFAALRQNVAEGEAQQFEQVAQAAASARDLALWRAYMDTVAAALRDKKKLVLDHAAAGRRHLLFSGPSALRELLPALMTPASEPPGSQPRED
ncbi:MAG TPA: cation-translocating P-type ATPase family protein [Pirellulales bacterium]|nr:cation-translocating P-type ATPase family protein [Pirellulales bacterium]